jgi:hypothetical protein
MKRSVFKVLLLIWVTSFVGVSTAKSDTPCRTRGLVGGAELTLFRLHARQGAGATNSPGNTDDYFPDLDRNSAGRFWFGYEFANGFGVRGRLFEWEESAPISNIVRNQDIEIYDVEATYDCQIHGWDLTGIGGVRWGSIELEGSDFGERNPMDFDGAGMTLGGELRHQLFGNFSAVAGARYSVLLGDTTFEPVSSAVLDDTFVDIKEIKLGVEWAMQTRFGGELFANAAWEHQIYGTDTYLPYAIDPETLGDVALSGPVFAIGFNR